MRQPLKCSLVMTTGLFPALLRYWRTQRGRSQLDLALDAGVSARHVSFLESGRARPSSEMVLRLMAALHVPLRVQNEALRAAGLPAHFAEPGLAEIDPRIQAALTQMMAQQEPFPLVVLGADFGVLQSNRAAEALFSAFVAEPAELPEVLNMFTLFFHPKLLRPFVQDWTTLARSLINRLHKEAIQRRGDERLQQLIEHVLSMAGVPSSFRHPDFSQQAPPVQEVRFEREGLRVAFLVTVTRFSAPAQVMLDELSVESCFPLDAETRATCERMAREYRVTPRG